MLKCPNCGEETLAYGIKFYASSLFPAECTKCKQLVGVRSSFAGSFVASIETFIILSMIFSGSFKPFVGAILLLIVFPGGSIIAGGFGGVAAITKSEVLVARIIVGIFAAFTVLALIF